MNHVGTQKNGEIMLFFVDSRRAGCSKSAKSGVDGKSVGKTDVKEKQDED